MARKQEQQPPKIIEDIMDNCLKAVGIEAKRGQNDLLVRLFLSGLARQFFIRPDDMFDIGFIHLEKSPKKEDLFTMSLIKNPSEGIYNADTLWKYYNGELLKEIKFKEVMENFFQELIDYSQEQELEITQLTSTIQTKKRRD